MAENNNRQEYVKIVLTLVMSLLLILFTQWVKLIKNPKSTPITKETIFGLVILGVFSILGIFIHGLVQKLPIKIIKDFPILGWVSMVSLAVCIVSPQVIEAINSVDFLSITVTSKPAQVRYQAVVTPVTPAPSTAIFFGKSLFL